VDFGNRTFGGSSSEGSSYINLALNPIAALAKTQTNILQQSFSSLSGNASVTLQTGANGNIDNSAFNGSVISFQNKNTVPAADILADIKYVDPDNPANTATGSVNAAPTANTVVNGISTWDQVRSVQTGVGTYSGVGSYTCSGGGCSGSGGMLFAVNVDFGNRVLGGTGSSITLGAGPTPGAITQIGLASDALTTLINPISFASGASPATIALLYSAGNHTNANFDNTTLSFQNQNGTPAQSMAVNLQFASGAVAATGSASGPLVIQQPISVTKLGTSR
jgi:hypothetical protein